MTDHKNFAMCKCLCNESRSANTAHLEIFGDRRHLRASFVPWTAMAQRMFTAGAGSARLVPTCAASLALALTARSRKETLRVPWIADGAVVRIVGRSAIGEFMHVVLSVDDCASATQPFRHLGKTRWAELCHDISTHLSCASNRAACGGSLFHFRIFLAR